MTAVMNAVFFPRLFPAAPSSAGRGQHTDVAHRHREQRRSGDCWRTSQVSDHVCHANHARIPDSGGRRKAVLPARRALRSARGRQRPAAPRDPLLIGELGSHRHPGGAGPGGLPCGGCGPAWAGQLQGGHSACCHWGTGPRQLPQAGGGGAAAGPRGSGEPVTERHVFPALPFPARLPAQGLRARGPHLHGQVQHPTVRRCPDPGAGRIRRPGHAAGRSVPEQPEEPGQPPSGRDEGSGTRLLPGQPPGVACHTATVLALAVTEQLDPLSSITFFLSANFTKSFQESLLL